MKHNSIPSRARLFTLGLLLAAGTALMALQPQAVRAAPSMSLNVGQISSSVAFFPLYVAREKGFFEKHDLHVGEIPLLGTGAKLAAALQSGSIDVAGGNGTDPLNLYRANKGTRMIGQLVNTYYVDIITGPSFKGPGVDAPLDARIKAMKGQKIGITGPGSGTQALVDFLLSRENMKSSTDVVLVSLGSNPSSALGALKTGRVDALSFPQPIGQQAEANDIGTIYISPTRKDIPELSSMVHGVVFTTQKVMDEKPAQIKAFVLGLADAEQFIHDASDADLRAVFKAYRPSMDDATVDRLLDILRTEIPSQPRISQGEFDREVQFNLTSGLINEAPKYEEMVPAKWLDSVLKDAS